MQDLQNVCPHGVAAIICVFSCQVFVSAFEEQNANMWPYDPVDTEHTGHCPPRQRRAPGNGKRACISHKCETLRG